MYPKQVFTEEVLVHAGVDVDSAWDLCRTLDTLPDLDIPDLIAPTSFTLAKLYELTNYDPVRIKDFLLFLGEKAVDIKEAPDSRSTRSFVWAAVKSLLTAQFFDKEMEQRAQNEIHTKGANVDAIKYQNYGEYGISRNLVMGIHLPTTRERMIRQLTQCAYLDGFGEDHDLSGAMKLIHTDPMRVVGLVNLGMIAEPLRVYCELIVHRGLSEEAIQAKYPDLQKKDALAILNNAEPFILFMLDVYMSESNVNEDEKTSTLELLLREFIAKNAKRPSAEPLYLTTQIVEEILTPVQIVNVFKRLMKRFETIDDQIEYLRKYHNILLPLQLVNGEESLTIDRHWLLGKLNT